MSPIVTVGRVRPNGKLTKTLKTPEKTPKVLICVTKMPLKICGRTGPLFGRSTHILLRNGTTDP